MYTFRVNTQVRLAAAPDLMLPAEIPENGVAATAASEPNIEDTLLAASIEGMEHDDLRVLTALTTWLSVHHQRVNADRLIRIASTRGQRRVLACWAAIAHLLNADRVAEPAPVPAAAPAEVSVAAPVTVPT